MTIEIKYTCPFGHTCEKVAESKVERCVLYLEMKVANNVTGDETSTYNCAFNWNVLLQHETNARVMGVQQATESFRNEMVVSQPVMLRSILNGIGND